MRSQSRISNQNNPRGVSEAVGARLALALTSAWGRWHRRQEVGRHRGVCVEVLRVPAPVRERLGETGSNGLVTMFAEAHKIATESFERRLAEETAKLRLDIANMKFELVKWNFLFWIGQLAAMTGILSLMLRGIQ